MAATSRQAPASPQKAITAYVFFGRVKAEKFLVPYSARESVSCLGPAGGPAMTSSSGWAAKAWRIRAINIGSSNAAFPSTALGSLQPGSSGGIPSFEYPGAGASTSASLAASTRGATGPASTMSTGAVALELAAETGRAASVGAGAGGADGLHAPRLDVRAAKHANMPIRTITRTTPASQPGSLPGSPWWAG